MARPSLRLAIAAGASALLLVAPDARAASGSVQLSDFRIVVTDLTPHDGIAAGFRFNAPGSYLAGETTELAVFGGIGTTGSFFGDRRTFADFFAAGTLTLPGTGYAGRAVAGADGALRINGNLSTHERAVLNVEAQRFDNGGFAVLPNTQLTFMGHVATEYFLDAACAGRRECSGSQATFALQMRNDATGAYDLNRILGAAFVPDDPARSALRFSDARSFSATFTTGATAWQGLLHVLTALNLNTVMCRP